MEYGNDRNGHPGWFFTGLMIGGLVGAAVGLLKAPRPGAETREQIQRKALELQGKAEQAVKDARSRVEEASEQVSHHAVELQTRGKQALEKGEKRLSKAVEETKRAADVWTGA
jgi:gas vesicle protein